MTFIERHIAFLTFAIGAMILFRIFMVTDANAFRLDGFEKGFLNYRSWLTISSTQEDSLAFKISQTLIRQRSGVPVSDFDQNIVTGSTDAPPAPQASGTPQANPASGAPASAQSGDAASKAAGAAPPTPAPSDAAPNQAAAPASPAAAPAAPVAQGEAERSLLERLGLRRSELEKKEQELIQREALLKAAEQRLTDRNAELKKLEADLKARVDQRNAELTSLKPIVTMYETMKPKDAARLFDKLDFPILLSVSTAMNPRKLSEVLALMDPALAGRLTQAMSTAGRLAVLPDPSAKPSGEGELPDLSPQGTP